MCNINDERDLLTIDVEQVRAEVLLLRPHGEIDMATAGYFRGELLAAVSAASGMVIVDLAGVSFLASSGLAALLDGRHRALERGVEVVLTGGKGTALRALEVTGLLTTLRHCESVERALDRCTDSVHQAGVRDMLSAPTVLPGPPASIDTRPAGGIMIFIVVKFTIRPERSGEWLTLVDDFTRATRNEPGNIFFEWSRSVDDPHQFVLVEAFQDDAAQAHVTSEHFTTAIGWMSDVVATTPDIVSISGVDGDGWGQMGEVSPR